MAGNDLTARADKGGWDEPEEQAADAAAPPASLLARLKGMGRKQLIALAGGLTVFLGVGVATLSGAADPVLGKLGLVRSEGGPVYVGSPIYVDLPDIVANLSVPGDEIHMLRASISLEVPTPIDKAVIESLMPRVQDALQAKLRALSPNDLKGTARIYRLRQDLLQRIKVAVGSAHVRELLFRDFLVL